MTTSQPTRHIAFIVNYAPRRCGIATFTTDLELAVSALAEAEQTPFDLLEAESELIAVTTPRSRVTQGE